MRSCRDDFRLMWELIVRLRRWENIGHLRLPKLEIYFRSGLDLAYSANAAIITVMNEFAEYLLDVFEFVVWYF